MFPKKYNTSQDRPAHRICFKCLLLIPASRIKGENCSFNEIDPDMLLDNLSMKAASIDGKCIPKKTHEYSQPITVKPVNLYAWSNVRYYCNTLNNIHW